VKSSGLSQETKSTLPAQSIRQ